jgi:phosphohistidine phosphatase
MNLYIVRHGIAEPRDEARPGQERALTPKGRDRTRRAALGLAALGCRPDRVGSSPLRRALETARIVSEVLCSEAPLDLCSFLKPGAAASDIAAWLQDVDGDDVMIVGHQPDMTHITSGLLSGKTGLAIHFKKAAACGLSFGDIIEPGAAQLEWLLQPRQLSTLAPE